MRKPFIFITKSPDGVLESNRISSHSFEEAMATFENVATEHNPSDYITNIIFEGMSGRICVMCYGEQRILSKEKGNFSLCRDYNTPESLVNRFEGQHPLFTKKEWREEVIREDVTSGYWEWVCSQLEQEADDRRLRNE